MNTKFLLTAVFLLIVSFAFALNPDTFVFRAGENGYSCFRAPTMVVTPGGTILVFSEGRVNTTRRDFATME